MLRLWVLTSASMQKFLEEKPPIRRQATIYPATRMIIDSGQLRYVETQTVRKWGSRKTPHLWSLSTEMRAPCSLILLMSSFSAANPLYGRSPLVNREVQIS